LVLIGVLLCMYCSVFYFSMVRYTWRKRQRKRQVNLAKAPGKPGESARLTWRKRHINLAKAPGKRGASARLTWRKRQVNVAKAPG
jgi:hypothetical protein